MTNPQRTDIMNAKRIALAVTAAMILAATALSGACVDKVDPCEEFNKFANVYEATCPQFKTWSTDCASHLGGMLPEDRQDFDWCVDCYFDLHSDPGMDCSEAPLGADCPTLLNTTLLNATLDATCTWPTPVL
jgi:hypothetical protein